MPRIDPRAEPMSDPPSGVDHSVERVAVEKVSAARDEAAGDPAESSVVPVAEAAASRVTSRDPRYDAVEKLLDANDWHAVRDELGALEGVGKLPPNLGLVAALAHNEATREGDPEAVAVAIRCMAGVLGVADDSPVARVLARRLLRKNPVRVRDIQAPPAKTSAFIVLLTLALGGSVGWMLSLGSWRAVASVLHLV